MAKSRADENRQIRREELRKKLAAGGHLQHVVEISDKLCGLDSKLDATQVNRLKAAADIKLALIKKYLPDIKQTEITGEDGGPVRYAAMSIEELKARAERLIADLG